MAKPQSQREYDIEQSDRENLTQVLVEQEQHLATLKLEHLARARQIADLERWISTYKRAFGTQLASRKLLKP